MKIRLISDLHIDVNDTWDVNLGENGVFTLIAGDICGTVADAVRWLRKNVQRGAFCAGNHLVYDPDVRKGKRVAIEDLKETLHREFPLDSDITFLDSDVGVVQKEIAPGVLLVADVLYTDYRLKIPRVNENGDPKANMSLAEPHGVGNSYMNDFVFGFTKAKMYDKDWWDDGTSRYGTPRGLWRLMPKYYLDHHERAWAEITEIVEKNPDKSVILMTHHCISPKCISEEYQNDALNASYVSDKEDWILAHPNVRLILSGHVHHRAHFTIGNALYVLNPLGYCRDTATQRDPETGRDVMWTPHCFIDTDTWKLTYEPYENELWDEIIEFENSKYARLAAFF